MDRNRALSLALAGVIGSGAVGWLAGTRIQSSNEAAAAARPPAASPVTVAVERDHLSADIVTRGTARYGQPRSVALPGPGIVTRAPVAGETIGDGDAFMEVDGLPVFALAGDRPSYRDLGPGDSGDDVRQLEEALARLGLDPGPVDGVFDAATSSAVERLYTGAGYTPEGPSATERSDLRAAQSAVDQAEAALAGAQRQLAEGTKPPTQAEIIQAESDVRKAEDARAGARQASTDDVRAAERAIVERDKALVDAEAQALADAETARRNVEDRALAAEVARASLSSEGAFGGDRAARLQAEQAARRADQELADARAVRDRQPAESQAKIDAARQALDDAREALPRTKTAGEAAIRDAETALTLARLRLDDLRAPKTSAALAGAVRDAEGNLADARETLAEVQAGIGAKVPAGSVVYFPDLPLRIDAVDVEPGDPAGGQVMTASGSELVVETAVTIAEAELLAPGKEVAIEAPDLGFDLTGRVLRIAEKPGTNGVSNQHVFVEIEPIDPPENFRDAAVRLTIPVQSTAGEVLVVPVAAISSDAAGNARVEVIDADGTRRQVEIAVGLSAGGRAEVTPLGEAVLAEGDRVVVGVQ